jgi:hypothetical protein
VPNGNRNSDERNRGGRPPEPVRTIRSGEPQMPQGGADLGTGKPVSARAIRRLLRSRQKLSGRLQPPTASDPGGGQRREEMGLDQQARVMWPRVRSHEVGEYQNQTDGTTQPTLTGIAASWPTPARRDYRSPNLKPYQERGGQVNDYRLKAGSFAGRSAESRLPRAASLLVALSAMLRAALESAWSA